MLKSRMLRVGLILTGLGAASCGSDSPQLAQPPKMQPAQMPKMQPVQPPKAQPAQPPKGQPQQLKGYNWQGSAQPVPPKGAQFTIFCRKIEGQNHVEMAEKIRNDLAGQTPLKEWHVIHQETESLLYYGYYKSIDTAKDAKESQRAQADRQRIAQMTDPMGNRPFRQAMLIELAAPDPAAPPEWNLVNAPGDLTLQVGTYKDSPQRKEAAVEAVREARKNGLEAYYYHGPTASLVCIGHWPSSAVVESNGIPRNSEEPYMIAPQTENPRLQQQYQQQASANNTRLVQPKKEVVDQTLLATMKQYPYNAVNGDFVKRVAEGETSYVPSVVVNIHEATGVQSPAAGAVSPVQSAYERIFQSGPAQQPQPSAGGTAGSSAPRGSTGQLRGIGG